MQSQHQTIAIDNRPILTPSLWRKTCRNRSPERPCARSTAPNAHRHTAENTISTERVFSDHRSNAVDGTVKWRPTKSLWIMGMTLAALIGGPLTFTWGALAVFVATCAITICGGHSVGMHRLLIHRSFKTPLWVERTLVCLGVLVGMAGPFGMIRLHDFRDWGQRQRGCHDFFSHRAGFFKDAWWQLNCGIDLAHEPDFVIEERVRNDWFYKFVERTWMAQQLPLAVVLFVIGGLPWVVWGICARVSISLIGHWLVGYFAHQPRSHLLYVEGACVQGYNLPKLGIITFGEAFHENHHAFPGSAKLGFLPGQLDPGWWLIRTLQVLGLAHDVGTPENLQLRDGLSINADAGKLLPDERPTWLKRIARPHTFG